MINVFSNQAASSHVKRLVGERGDWEVEVERLRSIFSHQEEGVGFILCGGWLISLTYIGSNTRPGAGNCAISVSK